MYSTVYVVLLATLTGAVPIKKDAHNIIARSPQIGSGSLPTGGLGGSSGGIPGIGGGSGGLPGIGSGSSSSGLPSIGGGSGGLPGIGGGSSGGSLPTPSFPIPTPGAGGSGGFPGLPTPSAGGLPGIGGGSGGLPGIGGGSGSGGLPGIGGGSGSSGLPGIGGGSGGLPGIGGGSSGSGSLPGIGSGSGGIPGIGGGSSTGTLPSSLPFPSGSLPSSGIPGGEPEAGPPFNSGNHRPDGPHPLGSGSNSGGVSPPEKSASHTKRQLGSSSSSTPSTGSSSTGGLGGLGGGSIPGLSGGSDTANDVQNGKCAPVTFIFARGTSEPGNVGSVVGPPTIQDLQQALGGANNLAAQGVNYPADFSGNIPGGDTTGKQSMTDLANQAVQKCPSTQLVLSGYSQGAIVTHDTMAQLPAATAQKVKAVVTFGDPDSRTAVQNIAAADVKIFCAQGDAVCEGTADITPAHLSYGDDAQPAAQFIAGKVQVGK